MVIERKIPLDVLEPSNLIPRDAHGDALYMELDDDNCSILFETAGGSAVFEKTGDSFHMRKWKCQPGIQGSIKGGEDLPIGSTLLEGAITACRNYIKKTT